MRIQADKTVDIRPHLCPMTWVRVKLALESLASGEVLEVLLRGDEPLRNIPKSAAAEGHELLATAAAGEESQIWIRKHG